MSTGKWTTVLALALTLVAAPAFGQGASTAATLSGVVLDKDGGAIPGATVVVTKVATGEKLPAQVTNAAGAYSFPGLVSGKYKVAISLQGFKTAEIEATLTGGSANSLSTKLEVGAVTEVVNVTAGTELVRTDTPTVSQTVSANFIQTLPRSDRNALSFLIFLPASPPLAATAATATTRRSPDCRTTSSTSRLTVSPPAICCSRATDSSPWSRRGWTPSKKSR
jgi:hypothetical protein